MATRTYYVDPAATGAGDGSSWTDAYTSLNACEAARQADLVTAGDTCVINCRTSGANPVDGSTCTFDGWTTDATHTITVQVAQASRAVGKVNTGKYRIEGDAGWNSVLIVNESYTTVIGVQVKNTAASGRRCISAGAGNEDFIGCIAYGEGDSGDTYAGFFCEYDIATVRYINCLSVGNTGSGFWCASSNARYYNCVSVGNGQHGFAVEGYRTFTGTNCYAGGNGAADCNDAEANTTFSLTTCASEDGTFGSTISYSTSAGTYFTNVTAGSEDVHVGASSSLLGAGTDLSGTFTTDIDGDTISTWMIGCDYYVATGGGGTTSARHMMNLARQRRK